MSALTFTPGKFYRTRDGRKAQVTAVGLRMRSGASIIAVIEQDGYDSVRTFMTDGRFHASINSGIDLIAEWKDAPEVDWSKMPAWANYVAMDGSGRWHWYQAEPKPVENQWCYNVDNRVCGHIPSSHVPKWSGDWRDSLVTRPTEGAQP